MIKTFSRILLMFILAFLAACDRKPVAYHEQLLVFGTVVDVKLWDIEEALGLNQLLASGESFTLPPSILPLIQRSSELSRRSNGLFNPAIGKLTALWGFASDDPPKGPPPSTEAIRAIWKISV